MGRPGSQASVHGPQPQCHTCLPSSASSSPSSGTTWFDTNNYVSLSGYNSDHAENLNLFKTEIIFVIAQAFSNMARLQISQHMPLLCLLGFIGADDHETENLLFFILDFCKAEIWGLGLRGQHSPWLALGRYEGAEQDAQPPDPTRAVQRPKTLRIDLPGR